MKLLSTLLLLTVSLLQCCVASANYCNGHNCATGFKPHSPHPLPASNSTKHLTTYTTSHTSPASHFSSFPPFHSSLHHSSPPLSVKAADRSIESVLHSLEHILGEQREIRQMMKQRYKPANEDESDIEEWMKQEEGQRDENENESEEENDENKIVFPPTSTATPQHVSVKHPVNLLSSRSVPYLHSQHKSFTAQQRPVGKLEMDEKVTEKMMEKVRKREKDAERENENENDSAAHDKVETEILPLHLSVSASVKSTMSVDEAQSPTLTTTQSASTQPHESEHSAPGSQITPSNANTHYHRLVTISLLLVSGLLLLCIAAVAIKASYQKQRSRHVGGRRHSAMLLNSVTIDRSSIPKQLNQPIAGSSLSGHKKTLMQRLAEGEQRESIANWQICYDEYGRTYFINTQTGVSQWEYPEGFDMK